jgi:hypothetical protein
VELGVMANSSRLYFQVQKRGLDATRRVFGATMLIFGGEAGCQEELEDGPIVLTTFWRYAFDILADEFCR